MVATSIHLIHYQGSKLSFELDGQPESQPRPRFRLLTRPMYNKKKQQLEQTRTLICGMLHQMGVIKKTGNTVTRHAYGEDDRLVVHLSFFLRRPNVDTSGTPRSI